MNDQCIPFVTLAYSKPGLIEYYELLGHSTAKATAAASEVLGYMVGNEQVFYMKVQAQLTPPANFKPQKSALTPSDSTSSSTPGTTSDSSHAPGMLLAILIGTVLALVHV